MVDVIDAPVQQLLQARMDVLAPHVIEIVNESQGHGGYYPGKESHFKLTIVSPVFDGLRAVQRHQRVYAAAGDLLSVGKIHALAIHAYAPSEWQGQSVDSPNCAHQ